MIYVMRITVAQLLVTPDIAKNKEKVLSVLRAAQPNDWVVFPECMLTGYFPEEEWFMKGISFEAVNAALSEIEEVIKDRQCYCLLGAATLSDGKWHNSTVMYDPTGSMLAYSKVEVSDLDKKYFEAGTLNPVYTMGNVTFGVQICREVLFPAAWAQLKKQGAQVVFHINNAIKPYDDVWEHVIIARAVENSYVVCSVNNAAEPQKLSSYLVDSTGRTLVHAERQREQVVTYEIEL
jgi:predicted amidohydrolase